MKSLRKAVSVVVSLAMVLSMLLFSACGTPANALTVDGRAYSTGEYLANLWNTFINIYYGSGLYQYAMYGMDPWEQTASYGEGDAAQELALVDYIKATTKDAIVRQAAVKKLMEQYGIAVSEEEMTTALEDADGMLSYYGVGGESKIVSLGFNKESFTNMYLAAYVEEQELFYQLYGADGQKAVSEADLKAYYDNGFFAYKAITLQQVNADGETLTDAEIENNRATLQGYLDLYEQTGDMDTVISQYNADTETTTATTTTTTAATTTTTAASEEATTTTTTTTTVASTTGTTTTTNPNLLVVTTLSGDEKVVEAVKSVPVGTAQIVKYTDSNDTTYLALIYREDIAAAGEEYTFETQRESCIYGIKFEEFDTEVQALADTLEVAVETRAIDMCDPKNFEAKMNEYLGLA